MVFVVHDDPEVDPGIFDESRVRYFNREHVGGHQLLARWETASERAVIGAGEKERVQGKRQKNNSGHF